MTDGAGLLVLRRLWDELSLSSWIDDHTAEPVVLHYLAGHAAAKLLSPNAPLGHGHHNPELAIEILRFLGEEDALDEWRARADAFVIEEREAISALTLELLEHETLAPFVTEAAVDVARGDATPERLARVREFCDSPAGS